MAANNLSGVLKENGGAVKLLRNSKIGMCAGAVGWIVACRWPIGTRRTQPA